MRGVLRMNRTLIGWFALGGGAFFARVVLRCMMNVFLRRVRRRDYADRAPQHRQQDHRNSADMLDINHLTASYPKNTDKSL